MGRETDINIIKDHIRHGSFQITSDYILEDVLLIVKTFDKGRPVIPEPMLIEQLFIGSHQKNADISTFHPTEQSEIRVDETFISTMAATVYMDRPVEDNIISYMMFLQERVDVLNELYDTDIRINMFTLDSSSGYMNHPFVCNPSDENPYLILRN